MRAKDEWALVERMMTGDYSPDQPRDENGRWTDSGAIASSVVGYNSGQMDVHMGYKEGDEEIGYIDYADYEGTPYIKYITVSPEHRRKGIASRLLKQLQREYPDTEIDWGMTTPEGTALKEKVAVRIENRTAIKVNKALRAEQEKLEGIEKKLNDFYEIMDNRDLTEQEDAEIQEYGKAWDESYAKVRALEDAARGMKEYKYMIPID